MNIVETQHGQIGEGAPLSVEQLPCPLYPEVVASEWDWYKQRDAYSAFNGAMAADPGRLKHVVSRLADADITMDVFEEMKTQRPTIQVLAEHPKASVLAEGGQRLTEEDQQLASVALDALYVSTRKNPDGSLGRVGSRLGIGNPAIRERAWGAIFGPITTLHNKLYAAEAAAQADPNDETLARQAAVLRKESAAYETKRPYYALLAVIDMNAQVENGSPEEQAVPNIIPLVSEHAANKPRTSRRASLGYSAIAGATAARWISRAVAW